MCQTLNISVVPVKKMSICMLQEDEVVTMFH
jgi:hypothetical protein